MRIITGKYKGRILASIPEKGIRPATDRVKSSIFNMLQNRLRLQGAEVLDLFAGSGSLGFEALSRGANKVVFVDDNSSAMDVVEENAEKLDCLSSCLIIEGDSISYLEKNSNRFDLIFADPPYAYERTSELPKLIFKKKILKEDGLLIIEHSKHTMFESSPSYILSIKKEFGNTRVSFFIYPS